MLWGKISCPLYSPTAWDERQAWHIKHCDLNHLRENVCVWEKESERDMNRHKEWERKSERGQKSDPCSEYHAGIVVKTSVGLHVSQSLYVCGRESTVGGISVLVGQCVWVGKPLPGNPLSFFVLFYPCRLCISKMCHFADAQLLHELFWFLTLISQCLDWIRPQCVCAVIHPTFLHCNHRRHKSSFMVAGWVIQEKPRRRWVSYKTGNKKSV